MASIKFLCPECHQPLEFDETAAGYQVECPACSKPIIVPYSISAEEQKGESKGTASASSAQKVFESGAQQAKAIFNDLKQISFKEEVLPIDSNNVQQLMRDFIFWAVTLLGIVPLLIVTIQENSAQLTMFALFFAAVWGVIFKKFVLNDNGGWQWPLASLFFTGIAGIWLLLFVYKNLLPNFYLRMPDSENELVSLFGFIFQVGVWEEMCKALPLLLLVKWQKSKVNPVHLVTVGVFSGLGFAAFENLHYGENAVFSTYSLTRQYGVEGLVTGVQNAMVVTMLRAVSLVFCHAVFSGIVAYFVATALLRKERVGALIVLGIGVAAVLHGLYDWFAGIQPTIAALLAGFSFALFYGYLSKLKSMQQLYAGLPTA